ncbi:hypothetical protein A2U01_0073005, partial [Trifolium medium]|nr:hypothetical protein [Trifolium medium]
GREPATERDGTSESPSLQRENTKETLRNLKVPRCSDRQTARWEARWATIPCS